jgi:uncharacterized protein (DUF2336 family)
MANPTSSRVTRRSAMAAELIGLAQEKSSQKRVELLRRITDTYLDQSAMTSPAEQFLFDDIVTKIVGSISTADKIEVSESLSKLPEVPEVLARTLATDSNIEVARPLVRDHRGLSEKILIDVATTGSQDHLHAVASRDTVTEPVTDVVVRRGDRRVTQTLAGNQGAQFSREGMRTLIGKAEKDGDLQALIVGRADLSIEAIGNLLPLISQEMASRLRGKAAEFDQSIVRKHFVDWVKGHQENISRIDSLIEGISKGDLKLDDVAMELMKGKRLFDVAMLLAGMIDLDRYHAFSVLTRAKTESVLLLMRSAQISWRIVDTFLKLRRTKMDYDEDRKQTECGEYETIDAATAQRVVRFLKVRRMALAAPADDGAESAAPLAS